MSNKMAIDIHIPHKVLFKTEQALERVTDKVRNRVVKSSLNFAATPISSAAKKNCPKRSGNLKKSIGKKRIDDYSNGIFQVRIGARTGPKFKGASRYAHLVEFGTVHSAARPFLRPAFEQNKNEAVDRYKKKVAEGVNKQIRKNMVKGVK